MPGDDTPCGSKHTNYTVCGSKAVHVNYRINGISAKWVWPNGRLDQYSSNARQQYLLRFLASRGCLDRCLGFICCEMLFWMCYNIAHFVINEVEWGNKQGNRNLCLDLSRLWLCCINEQFQLSILSLLVFLCLTWPTHTGYYLNLSPAWSANFWLTTNSLGSVSMPVSSRWIWKQWALNKRHTCT